MLPADYHRPFGNTGFRVPPIVFGTCALGDANHVIPDQTKRSIVGEWFKHVDSPVFIDVSGDDTCRQNILLFLSQALTRLDIEPDEVAINVRLAAGPPDDEGSFDRDAILECWEESCRLLGNYLPKLVTLDRPDAFVSAASTLGERDRRRHLIVEACSALGELKSDGNLAGVGVAVHDWRFVDALVAAAQIDWVTLLSGFTVMTHPPDVPAFLRELEKRQVAVVNADVFESGFLVGGDKFNSQRIDANSPDSEGLFKWRKAFTALCHGHGVTPAHACVQFALSGPGIAAVALDTSHPDRVAEKVSYVTTKVPGALWESMEEEGLI